MSWMEIMYLAGNQILIEMLTNRMKRNDVN